MLGVATRGPADTDGENDLYFFSRSPLCVRSHMTAFPCDYFSGDLLGPPPLNQLSLQRFLYYTLQDINRRKGSILGI